MTPLGSTTLALAVLLAVAVVAGRLSPKHYPVLLAYAIGLAIGATGGLTEADRVLLDAAMRAAVALAIPGLLLASSLARLRALGREGLLAGACVWGGASAAAALLLVVAGGPVTDVALTLAIFTGSLANLQAAGLALGVPDTTLVAANLGDVITGGGLFLLLTSVGPGVLRWVLGADAGPTGSTGPPADADTGSPPGPTAWLAAAALSVGCLAVGLLASAVLAGPALPDELFVLGAAAVAAVAAASTFVSGPVAAAGTRFGEGLLIAFCLLVGTGASPGALYGEALAWAGFMGAFLVVELAVAVGLARLFGLRADPFLLALAGAVYSPAFVGPVAHAARRPDLVAVGVAWGLLGLALGTPAALALVALAT